MAIEALSSIRKGGIDAFSESGGGSATVYSVEVDFGVPGVPQKFFNVAVASATALNKVVVSPSLSTPPGVDEDELEMDMIVCAARVSEPGVVRILVSSINGSTISGKRFLNLILG